MNAEQLLQHFERISEAPDAIPSLRRFILNLAVRGKLVEQDPSDEPASELLKRIEVEKARRVKEGSLRQQSPLPPVKSEEVEFDLAQGWQWVRMSEVIKLWNGFAFKSGDYQSSGVPVVRIGDLQGGEVDISGVVRVSEMVAKQVSHEVWIPPDALLIAMSGATTGKTAFNRTRTQLLLNQRVGRIEVFVMNIEFLRFFFETIVAKNLSISFGTAIPNLSAQQINETVVPLPPLAEQQLIVAKVDELMSLCDLLEEAKKEREQCRDSLVAASLQGLNQPAEEEESFRQHARFTFTNLPRITTRTTHIKQLRQTILNLAVRGKLVEQNPSDETAINFLNRIAAEKVRPRTITKAIKGNVFLAPEETPFSIPASWEWACFADYALDISTGPFGSALHQSDYVLNGIPLVNPSHMIKDKIRPDPKVSVSNKTAERLEGYRMKEGDIVMARRGEVGRAALVTKKEVGWLCGTGSFFVSFTKEVHRDHILLLLRSELVRSYLSGKAIGTTMTNLNHGILKKMPLPIPPLAEQHRIVAKVDELMAICDQLEAQITATEQDSGRFLESVLADALAPGIECNHH